MARASARARPQLRASGETRMVRTPEARDQLTPQELQIAQLAAAGLSNREIGERLFVRIGRSDLIFIAIYPKIGARSRRISGTLTWASLARSDSAITAQPPPPGQRMSG